MNVAQVYFNSSVENATERLVRATEKKAVIAISESTV